MTIYDRLQATTQTMLQNYGQQITFLQAGPAVYNPATGKNTPTQTTYLGTGALLDFSQTAPSVTTIRGTEIQQGDKLLYLGMQGTLAGVPVQIPQPNTDDTVIDSAGVAYNIQSTTTIDPAGNNPVVHILHVRGVPRG
jgi:hypothetical protein